jgi:XTP/dITP diphosphohydrolase
VLPGEEGRVDCALGECAGALLETATGDGGFGYDPIFAPALDGDDADRGRSMAQLSEARKNDLSHRARALRALVQTVSWESLLAT